MVERIPQFLDFVIGLLQVLALVFLAYGAYLATRRTRVPPILGEPSLGSADADKKLVLEGSVEARPERRSRTRRRADRRSGPSENLYGLAR